MFNQKTVDEYRCLTAPDSLYDRVMEQVSYPAPIKCLDALTLRRIAACVAVIVILGCAWIFSYSEPVVSVTPGSSMSYSATASRSNSNYAVVFIDAKNMISIKTNDIFYTEDNGYFEPIGSRLITNRGVTLYWFMEGKSASLTVNGVLYTIFVDDQSDKVTIVQD